MELPRCIHKSVRTAGGGVVLQSLGWLCGMSNVTRRDIEHVVNGSVDKFCATALAWLARVSGRQRANRIDDYVNDQKVVITNRCARRSGYGTRVHQDGKKLTVKGGGGSYSDRYA